MTGKHTPGPWAWFGNARSNYVYLATEHSGRRFVMDFVRWGTQGAQPRFQATKGVMVEAKHLLQFEVGDRSIVGVDAARKDSSVYRLDIRGIDCADARLIAAAPELLEALQSLQSFVAVIFGCGPNAEIPDTIHTPLGVPVKIGAIMRDAAAAIAKAEGTPLHPAISTREIDDADMSERD